MPRQQITRPSKPGEERGECKHVERRNLAAVVNRAVTVRNWRVPGPMKVRVREMQAQPTGDENHHAQKEPDHKTDQIKIRPGHSRAPFLPLPVAACGCNASSSLSASPGVSRIAPISKKLFRVSFSRASLISTSLT